MKHILMGAILASPFQKFRAAPDEKAGGGAMTEETFRGEVLTGVKSIKQQFEDLSTNVDGFQKETKKALDDLTTAKNAYSGLSADVEQVTLAFRKLQSQLTREKHMAFGNPIARIAGDEELRSRFNAAVRLAVSNSDGDMRKVAKDIMGKALGEDSSPGSTLFTDDLLKEIYDSLESYGAWSSVGVRRMGTKITKMPIKTARPIAYWLMSEADTIADDANKAGTSVNLEVELLAVLINVSLQLLQDAEFDVTADVMNDFMEALSYRLDYSTFQGAGTATGTAAKLHGGVTGMFNFATAATAAAGEDTVEELDLEDFTACLLAVDAGVLNRRTKWWMHPRQLIRTLSVKDGNGRPIFLTAIEAPTPGALGSILGSPVVPVLAAPSANTADAKIAVFGDPEAYVVGIRQDFVFEASDHARWTTFQRSFRGVGRASAKGRKASALAALTLGSAG